MPDNTRKESSQIAHEIVAKFEPEKLAGGITPELSALPILAIAHALLAINTQLVRLGNEVSSTKTTIQALGNRR